MGTPPALLAVVCWLAISDIGLANNVNSSKVVDHISEASAPRLYRNVPPGVYASAAPYGAYSIQFPRFVNSPKPAASHVVPVLHNINGYLRDSYGNRFTGPPHTMAYKSAFPQQYVQIQELPDHLVQPLSASASPFQFQPSSSRFPGAHFTFPSLQGPTPTPINQFGGSSQPLVYGNIRNVGPAQQQLQLQAAPAAQHLNSQPQLQRLQEVTVHNGNIRDGPNHKEVGNPEASSAQTAITTVVNGKKTVINVETNPPIPLLDLSLLEPLTFANPLVPQVQHFLPKIANAVYHKLPQPNIKGAKNYQKEFVIEKTKSYDSGHGDKPYNNSPKKQKKPAQDTEGHHEVAPLKPAVIITSTPNESPEFSYEINSPNYKETYKEKAVKYNKVTNSEPVHYAYGKNTESEPVTYSYTHHSKEPAQIKQVHYEINGKEPVHLVYNIKPDEQDSIDDDKPRHSPQREHSEDSGESNEEIDEEAPIYHKRKEHYEDTPKRANHNPDHREHYEELPKKTHNHNPRNQGPPKPQNYNQAHRDQYEDAPKKTHNINPEQREHYQETPKKPHNYNQEHREQYENAPKKLHSYNQEDKEQYEDAPKKSHSYHPEHRAHYQETPKKPHNYNQERREHFEDAPKKSHNYNQEHKEQYEDAPKKSQSYHPEHREHYQETPKKPHNYDLEHREQFEDPPKKSHNYNQESRDQYENAPKKHNYNSEQREHYQETPKRPHNYNQEQYEDASKKPHHYDQEHREQYDDAPKKSHNYHPEHRQHYQDTPKKPHNYNQEHRKHFDDTPKKAINYNLEPKQQYEEIPSKAHNEEQRVNHPPRQEVRHEIIIHHDPPKQYSEPIEVPLQNSKEFEAITPEYEEDIRLLPTHAPHAAHPAYASESPHASIKVDPNQHVKNRPPSNSERESSPREPQHHQYERDHDHSPPHEHLKSNGPTPHIHEQSKLIIMQEETPDEMHSLREQMMAEVINQEENNEEDFEKAYNNAAVGFPAFERQAIDIEKHIYDPRGYGVPRDHAEYVLEHAPFQEYQEEDDDFPKKSRANYKDISDKNKEGYYSDYAVARPQSLNDRYHKKEDYFKLYKQQKPERYYSDVDHDDKKKERQSAKYTVLPTYSYNREPEQNKKQFAQYKAVPQKFLEYEYPKAPRDNSAFASGPHHWYKSRTHFVEPQFQYGFDPISVPRLLDSELSAMASNHRPESEKPGMRKKIYKENWYIKKTSTSGGEPAS